jgi:hypothetical protein
MQQRLLDWFWTLNLAQKVLAVLFGALVLFSVSYLVSTTVLGLMGPRMNRPTLPLSKGPLPASPTPKPRRQPALRYLTSSLRSLARAGKGRRRR